MTTQWMIGVIQITKNIGKIEEEMRRLEAVVADKQLCRISVEHENKHLQICEENLRICRVNLRYLLDPTQSEWGWQVSDFD
jgi:uncharacterized membrane protein